MHPTLSKHHLVCCWLLQGSDHPRLTTTAYKCSVAVRHVVLHLNSYQLCLAIIKALLGVNARASLPADIPTFFSLSFTCRVRGGRAASRRSRRCWMRGAARTSGPASGAGGACVHSRDDRTAAKLVQAAAQCAPSSLPLHVRTASAILCGLCTTALPPGHHRNEA